MKPRIRTVKPEALADAILWDSEQELQLPLFRAFVGLWCAADREGRFEWKPRELKLVCLPWWDGDFSRVLDALTTRGFLVRYAIQGREYGLVKSFKKHQAINGKEPASELPAPPKEESKKPVTYEHVSRASVSREPRDEDASFPSLPFPSVPDPVPQTDPPDRLGSCEQPTRSSMTSLESALRFPIAERAALVEQHLDDRAWIQLVEPHKWPEVVSLAEALSNAEGRPPPTLGAHHRDAGVRAVVGLLASVAPEVVIAALPRIVDDDWWKRERPGLCGLTVNQINKAQGPAPKRETKRGQTPTQPNYGVKIDAEEYQ